MDYEPNFQNSDITFGGILERDMDLLVAEEFWSNQEFANIFLEKIIEGSFGGSSVLEVHRSQTDSRLGESDLAVLVECGEEKIALLIEDKIDACAQPEQCQRYKERGNLGKKNGLWDDYFDFILAPEKYLKNNNEAQKYTYAVTYEEIQEYFQKEDRRSQFKAAQIESALYRSHTGWIADHNEEMASFFQKVYELSDAHYPRLKYIRKGGAVPAGSCWQRFTTVLGTKVFIEIKFEKGYVDLTFSGLGDRVDQLRSYFGRTFEDDKRVVKASKSAAVRIVTTPVIDFHNQSEPAIIEALAAASLLDDFATRITDSQLSEIYSLPSE